MKTQMQETKKQIDILNNGFSVAHTFQDNDVISRLYDKTGKYTGIEIRSMSPYVNRTALAAAVVHC